MDMDCTETRPRGTSYVAPWNLMNFWLEFVHELGVSLRFFPIQRTRIFSADSVFFLSFFDMCYIPIQILPILHSFTRISKFWNSVPSCLPAFAGNLFFPGDVQLHRRKTWRCHAGGVQSGAMQTSKNHETRICPACFFWFQTLVSTWTSILDSLTKMVDRIYQQLVGLTRRSAPVW